MSRERLRPEQFCSLKIKSVVDGDQEAILNKEQLQELQDLYEGSIKNLQQGKLIVGKVIKVDSDGVLVDIKYKSQGLIPNYEFNQTELKKLKSDSDIEVIIENLENRQGTVVLSYEKAKAMRVWESVTKLFEENKPIEGTVTHKVKGGLSVDVGIPAFLPGSQIDLQRVTDFDQYVGQTITANILKLNKKRGNIIISRRKYLHESRSEERQKILEGINEGQVIQGVVKNITNYGAFVDLGGIDGLLHITDITWGRISHPSESLKISETVSVKILSFDKETEKISLGMKQLEDNPWEEVDKKLKVGDKIKGKISSITDYGLFVEVAPHVEGLIHISEVSWTDRISHLSKRYKVGEEIDILVVSLDKDNRRMSLSVKQLETNPWEAAKELFKVGEKIKGKISNITDFGIFVQLSSGIDGLVHISDISWTEHIGHPGDQFKLGNEVEAIVLSVDVENKKISLGIKQLSEDPWTTLEKTYKVDDIIEGEIRKIANFGAFVKLPNGIEGLLHNSTLSYEQSGKKATDLYKIGDKVQLRIANINKEERKIALSSNLEGKSFDKPTTSKAPRKTRSKEPRSATSSTDTKIKSSLQIALEEAMQKDDSSSDK